MRTALRSTAPWMGHKAWMYVSSAGVSGGLAGAAGRESAAATTRREVASRATATITIPMRIRRPTAIRTRPRREMLGESLSARGIIGSARPASWASQSRARIRYSASHPLSTSSAANWTDLSARRVIGAQHPEPPAEIGVPDVVRAIDGDAERTGIGAWQTKFRHAAVTQPAQTPTPELAEPHGAVGRHGERGEAGRWRGNRELRESTVHEAPDLVRLLLEEPHGAAGIDGHVAEPAAARRDIEFRHLAVSGDAGQPVHVDRKSTRLNSSHLVISYAVFCLKKKKS